MLRLRSVHEWAGHVSATELETHRDNLDPLWMDLAAQCLPPGQVARTPSIGRPGDQHHLLAKQGREREWSAIQVGQHQVRRLRRLERSPTKAGWSERPQTTLVVLDERHPQPLRDGHEVERGT